MTKDDVLFGDRLQVFDLAGRTSVSNACRVFGIHRSTYYAWKAQVDRGGLEMLRPRERRHVERLHRTILEECWRPAFARYVYVRFTGLRRDLDHYLHTYNHDRVHHGRLTQGRIPTDIVYGARKMEPR
jgi:Helix-turn-helix domain